MKTKLKIIMFFTFGLVLLASGVGQVMEDSIFAIFPLFAGVVMIATAHRWKKGGNS